MNAIISVPPAPSSASERWARALALAQLTSRTRNQTKAIDDYINWASAPVAFVGPPGSGKSRVAAILNERVSSGDNVAVDLESYSSRTLRFLAAIHIARSPVLRHVAAADMPFDFMHACGYRTVLLLPTGIERELPADLSRHFLSQRDKVDYCCTEALNDVDDVREVMDRARSNAIIRLTATLAKPFDSEMLHAITG